MPFFFVFFICFEGHSAISKTSTVREPQNLVFIDNPYRGKTYIFFGAKNPSKTYPWRKTLIKDLKVVSQYRKSLIYPVEKQSNAYVS